MNVNGLQLPNGEADENELARTSIEEMKGQFADWVEMLTGIKDRHSATGALSDETNALLEKVREQLEEAAAACTQISSFRDLAEKEDQRGTALFEQMTAAADQAATIIRNLEKDAVTSAKHTSTAEANSSRINTLKDTAQESGSALSAMKAQADLDVVSISTAKESGNEAVLQLKGLADKAKAVQKELSEYETELEGLIEASKMQLITITDLLPGATSAGLAHAFDQRRQSFIKPSTRWQWLFVGSVTLLAILALTGLLGAVRDGVPLSYDELLRLWLARLPIAGALIWLALHSSQESALAKRLEEDYGYKAAIAASFQGFQKMMAETTVDAQSNTPLAKLCEDTLATLASSPGRIYDKHKLTVSPSGELANAAKTITEGLGGGKN